jgi:hypothetical protein
VEKVHGPTVKRGKPGRPKLDATLSGYAAKCSSCVNSCKQFSQWIVVVCPYYEKGSKENAKTKKKRGRPRKKSD